MSIARGDQIYRELLMREPGPASGPLGTVARSFVFGEIWDRPGLSRRDRRWIGLVCVAATHARQALEMHVYGALNTDDVGIDAMSEFLLTFAVYRDWSKAAALEAVIAGQWAAIQQARGETVQASPSIANDRLDMFVDHVSRNGALSPRDRRIIAICCLALDGGSDALRTHVTATLRTGELTREELDEIALHFAVYGGFPRGSALGGLVTQIHAELV